MDWHFRATVLNAPLSHREFRNSKRRRHVAERLAEAVAQEGLTHIGGVLSLPRVRAEISANLSSNNRFDVASPGHRIDMGKLREDRGALQPLVERQLHTDLRAQNRFNLVRLVLSAGQAAFTLVAVMR